MFRRPVPADMSPLRVRLRAHVIGFARAEDGVTVLFAMFVLMSMMVIGGMAIDVMHNEMDRTRLQNTLDRAILAAADLDQELDPESVVEDYFAKAGMAEALADVTVSEGINFRTVTASASQQTETQFLQMVGVETLSAPAVGTAEERIDGVEISLVLDVSGSMRWNNRLPNLKIAAKDFVDEMLDNSEEGKVSISIVPYATQVSLTDEFMAQFNTTDEHSYSNCINFESDHFDTTEIDTSEEFKRTMHFDPWDDMDGRDNDPKILVTAPVCEASDAREMMVLQNDRDDLKDFIDDLSADGNTSIDLGMKWGAALLDPSLSGVVDNLVASNDIPSEFVDRPAAYNDANTIKVIVLMTDGENTTQYYVRDGYRTGMSNIWWNDQEEIYSVYVPYYDEFYWPAEDEWEDHAYGNGDTEGYCKKWNKKGTKCKNWQNGTSEPGTAVQLSYADLWAYTTLEWNVEEHYEPWMWDDEAWDEWYYDVRGSVGSSTKNSRTYDICDAAKDKNIIVFSIGFEAPSNGRTVLKNCASSDSHYYDVDGLEIADAFEAIAASIRQLRLTQ